MSRFLKRRRALPTSSTTPEPLKRLSYFVICPNVTLGPFVLDLEGGEIVDQLRDKIYEKHKLLREHYDYSELVLYKKPDNLTRSGDGELIDRATVSIATKDPLEGDSEVNDVFGQDSGNVLVHVVVKIHSQLLARQANYSLALPKPTANTEYGNLVIMYNYLWKNGAHLGQIITKSSIQVPGLAVSYELQESETEDLTMDDTPTKDEASQPQEEDVAMDDAAANIQASFYDLMQIPNVSSVIKEMLDVSFYVRDEYRELDAFVEEQRQSDVARRSRRTPILLIGQPGIGARKAHRAFQVAFNAFRVSQLWRLPYSFDDWDNPEVSAAGSGDYGLSLFDLSSGEGVNTLASRWRTLVASSPESRKVDKWVKENHVKKFYMKTWSWQEVYVSRNYAMEQRTEDNDWRIAFMSHRLVEINPLRDAEGLDRSSSCTQIISQYIFTKLMEKKGLELVNASAQYFYNCMKEPSTASTAGLMFEAVGHVYVVKRARGWRYSIDKVHHPDATKYYRPVSGNLTGIDSFAFERDENHPIISVVLFQYTISTRHSVKMGFLKQLWDALKNEHWGVWQWKLVFVIPKDEDRKAFRKKMPTKPLMTAVSQFALEIDLEDMWETMRSSH
ncbi:uncharacterized protein EI90DRAFT_3020059 [Cantharellus anzutake]|uniref:uncharacterized protein n=1 Tax=Cantharellus anzutake TaxID=1750568 RepID=UPI001905CB98|nr:uncharacterized protein EI90DRAFT_3020059 [Cantharellus anzutake]KAF8322804.1 hypothetical protein EI90DRAFT_3020059 [Cantharellus anzutake]